MTSAFDYQDVPMMTSADNVGTGWHQIIRDLETRLNEIDPHFQLLQVKEKFGALRYYAAPAKGADTEEFHLAIRVAEAKSALTCEKCGAKAETKSSHGWFVTLCDEHFAEREAIRKMEDDLRDQT
jgi:hypothetical protein